MSRGYEETRAWLAGFGLKAADDATAVEPRKREKAAPTPFGKARAEELWARRGANWDMGHVTDGEDAYVMAIWAKMPGWTCWMDAFLRILNGHDLPAGFEKLA